MAYTKTTWRTDDVITAEKLNNAEQGIAQNAHDIDQLKSKLFAKQNKSIIYADDFEAGYYSTVNGQKYDNASSTNYSRTKHLIPADEKRILYIKCQLHCCLL